MAVRKSRQLVSKHGHRHRRSPTSVSLCAALWLVVLGALVGCAEDPEHTLSRRWREADWQYERLDMPVQGALGDTELARQNDRRIVRHEAEYWEFREDSTLLIAKRDGSVLRRRWHLKGRGHVLAINAEDGSELEIYDVKELNERELVLHYDIGLEVNGIARLSFRSVHGRGRSRANGQADVRAAAGGS